MSERQPSPDKPTSPEILAPNIKKEIETLRKKGLGIIEKMNGNNWGKEHLLPHIIAIKDISKGMVLFGTPTAALLSVALELNYHRTRWNVDAIPTTSEVLYEHEDTETTAILNYFAGRGRLPEHIELAIYRDGIAKVAKVNNYPLPNNFTSMNKSELQLLLTSYFTPGPHDRHHFSSPQEMADTFFMHAIPTYKRNDHLYALLWKLEQEVGNPTIRFSFIETHEDDEERAFYRPSTNTAYIFQENPFQDLIAEFAHADQYNENYFTSNIAMLKATFETGIEMLSKGVSYRKAYDATQYPTPGTLEHTAHPLPSQQKLLNTNLHREYFRLTFRNNNRMLKMSAATSVLGFIGIPIIFQIQIGASFVHNRFER
jgi:hypothetical protein